MFQVDFFFFRCSSWNILEEIKNVWLRPLFSDIGGEKHSDF